MTYEPAFVPMCSLCGEPVSLEDCKTDDGGRAVHERCYIGSLMLAEFGPSSSTPRSEPR
jgi:hypothetical protein